MSEKFIDISFKKFLEKIFVVKQNVSFVEKKSTPYTTPFLGAVLKKTWTKLQKVLKRFLNSCKLRVIFKCQNRLSSVLLFKERIPKEPTSGVV